MPNVSIKLLREGAKLPVRGSASAAGYDLYACLDGDYKLIYAVLAVCALAIVAALFVSSIAYYGLWVLAIGTFLLAVYYTVKIM